MREVRFWQLAVQILNLIVLAASVALIVVCALVRLRMVEAVAVAGVSSLAPVVLTMSASLLIFSILFNCHAARSANYCTLVTFCVFAFVMAIMILIIVIALFIYRNKITDTAIRVISLKSLEKYDIDAAIHEAWDSLQITNECCGVADFRDWGMVYAFNKTKFLPDSCCLQRADNCGKNQLWDPSSEAISTVGCVGRLSDLIRNNFLIIGITAIIVETILVTTIVVSALLAKTISSDYRKLQFERLDSTKSNATTNTEVSFVDHLLQLNTN